MALTNEQQATLKTYIEGDPELIGQPANSDGAFEIARILNLEHAPTFTVWRTSMTDAEINEAVDWAEVVELTIQEQQSFGLLKGQGTINPSKVSIRAAFNAIFPSNQQPNTNAGLQAAAKRNATRCERVLAIGTGTDQSPGTLTFEGAISYHDVKQVMGW